MKKLLPILSIVLLAVFMVACNQVPKPNVASQQAPALAADTTGLASYQLWKAQNELASTQQYNQPVSAAPQQEKQVIIYRNAPAPKVRTKSSSSKSSSSQSSPVATNSGVSNSDNGIASSTGTNEAKSTAKKGISKAAKGAIIGGVGGAIAGAVINKKNRVAGAIIGGVIGGGGGYAIGRGMDRKDGRVGSGSGTSTPPFSIPTGIFQK
ncbi:MAG: glycine zipper 2TM domain-containing protein [Flavisolibacter sp.]